MKKKFEDMILSEVLAQLEHGAYFKDENALQVFLDTTAFPYHVVWVPADGNRGIFIWGVGFNLAQVRKLEQEAVQHFLPHHTKKEGIMDKTIPSGQKFSSEEELKKFINDEPLLHGIIVVVLRKAKNELEVHSSTYDEAEAKEALVCAQAVAEQTEDNLYPYII